MSWIENRQPTPSQPATPSNPDTTTHHRIPPHHRPVRAPAPVRLALERDPRPARVHLRGRRRARIEPRHLDNLLRQPQPRGLDRELCRRPRGPGEDLRRRHGVRFGGGAARCWVPIAVVHARARAQDGGVLQVRPANIHAREHRRRKVDVRRRPRRLRRTEQRCQLPFAPRAPRPEARLAECVDGRVRELGDQGTYLVPCDRLLDGRALDEVHDLPKRD